VNAFAFSDFTDFASNFSVGGNTEFSNGQMGVVVSTSAGSKKGLAWYTDRLQARGVQVNFTVTLTSVDANDRPQGLVFVIQNDDLSAEGQSGDSLGYADVSPGTGGILDSFALELDCILNNPGPGNTLLFLP